MIADIKRLDVLIPNVFSARSFTNIDAVKTYLANLIARAQNLFDNYNELRGKDTPVNGWEDLAEKINVIADQFDRLNTILSLGYLFLSSVSKLTDMIKAVSDSNKS